jgi:hypothetical protein
MCSAVICSRQEKQVEQTNQVRCRCRDDAAIEKAAKKNPWQARWVYLEAATGVLLL